MNFSNLAQTYQRRKTRPVFVGQVGVGGNFPIRVQSMTTSDTKDVSSVIREMKQLVEVGCEIIRVTVPTQADCQALPEIRKEMKKEGIKIPLVADIHFTPTIAMQVVEYVEKVRINPGNFVDKKLFKVWEYTDAQYAEELVRIREKFLPLVQKCKQYGVAMRIGTNHGSLSDRIMNRYGDTPQGMVESALEFLTIAEEENYRDIILSMKASNVQVMIEAYRLLVKRLDETKRDYPLHLGVTEAGEGEDGRIKSAIGIGTLLEDGIGDTIRVSLTEDSVHEIPVAYQLVQEYNQRFFEGTEKEKRANLLSSPSPSRGEGLRERVSNRSSEPMRVWGSVSSQKLSQSSLEDFKKIVENKDQPLEGLEILVDENFKETPSWVFDLKIPLALYLEKMSLRLGGGGIKGEGLQCDNLEKISKIAVVLSKGTEEEISSWVDCLKKYSQKIEWVFSIQGHGKNLNQSLEVLKKTVSQDILNRSLFSVRGNNPVYSYRALASALDEYGLSGHHGQIHLRYKIEKKIQGSFGTLVKFGLSFSGWDRAKCST